MAARKKSTESAIAIPDDDAPLPAKLVEQATRYAGEARSANTRRLYESRCRHFDRWCKENGRRSLPATAQTLALYISSCAETLSVATIEVTMTAIAGAHRLAGLPNATDDRRVVEVMRGIRRVKGTKQIGKKPLLSEYRSAIYEAIPSTIRGDRDRAIIAIGFAGAFRRSELVAIKVEDIERVKEGCVINIGRSKTDQEGVGARVAIPKGRNSDVCPIRLLDVWLDHVGASEGPVFRRVTRWDQIGSRLTAQSIALVVKEAVRRVGLDAMKFGGHSLRAGLATSAAKARKPTFAIKAQGRWSSSQTLDRYIRDIALFDDNAADLD